MKLFRWPARKVPKKAVSKVTVKSLHSDILDLKRSLTWRLALGLLGHLALGYWAHTYLYTPWNDARYTTQAYVQEMQAAIKSELLGEIQKGFADMKAKPGRPSIAKTSPSWAPFQK